MKRSTRTGILDGITAFYGSVNATLDGWTRLGEMIRFTNDRGKIQSFNHTCFCPFVIKRNGLDNNSSSRR